MESLEMLLNSVYNQLVAIAFWQMLNVVMMVLLIITLFVTKDKKKE